MRLEWLRKGLWYPEPSECARYHAIAWPKANSRRYVSSWYPQIFSYFALVAILDLVGFPRTTSHDLWGVLYLAFGLCRTWIGNNFTESRALAWVFQTPGTALL